MIVAMKLANSLLLVLQIKMNSFNSLSMLMKRPLMLEEGIMLKSYVQLIIDQVLLNKGKLLKCSNWHKIKNPLKWVHFSFMFSTKLMCIRQTSNFFKSYYLNSKIHEPLSSYNRFNLNMKYVVLISNWLNSSVATSLAVSQTSIFLDVGSQQDAHYIVPNHIQLTKW